METHSCSPTSEPTTWRGFKGWKRRRVRPRAFDQNIFKTSPLLNTELDLYVATGNVNCSGNKFDFGTSAEDASGPKVLFKTHQNPIYNWISRVVVERVWMVDWPILNFLATRLKGRRGIQHQFKHQIDHQFNLCSKQPWENIWIVLNRYRFLERVFALRQAALAGKSKWSRDSLGLKSAFVIKKPRSSQCLCM